MKKIHNYKFKMMEEFKMNADRYVFTEGRNEKEQAGTIVDGLVKKFLADHPGKSYETGLHKILALHENKKLAQAYSAGPTTLI